MSDQGEIEAARSVGMHRWLMFRRIVAPQVARYALPGLRTAGTLGGSNEPVSNLRLVRRDPETVDGVGQE